MLLLIEIVKGERERERERDMRQPLVVEERGRTEVNKKGGRMYEHVCIAVSCCNCSRS